MIDLFIMATVMFFAIPLIAVFDYLVFGSTLKNNMLVAIKEYNATGKLTLSPYSWIPACVMESLFFIAGLVIGYGLKG